jgi:hypothetical protein
MSAHSHSRVDSLGPTCSSVTSCPLLSQATQPQLARTNLRAIQKDFGRYHGSFSGFLRQAPDSVQPAHQLPPLPPPPPHPTRPHTDHPLSNASMHQGAATPGLSSPSHSRTTQCRPFCVPTHSDTCMCALPAASSRAARTPARRGRQARGRRWHGPRLRSRGRCQAASRLPLSCHGAAAALGPLTCAACWWAPALAMPGRAACWLRPAPAARPTCCARCHTTAVSALRQHSRGTESLRFRLCALTAARQHCQCAYHVPQHPAPSSKPTPPHMPYLARHDLPDQATALLPCGRSTLLCSLLNGSPRHHHSCTSTTTTTARTQPEPATSAGTPSKTTQAPQAAVATTQTAGTYTTTRAQTANTPETTSPATRVTSPASKARAVGAGC